MTNRFISAHWMIFFAILFFAICVVVLKLEGTAYAALANTANILQHLPGQIPMP